MSIENNPAIEILNTVVRNNGGSLFGLVITGLLTIIGIIFIIAFLVDWLKNCAPMDGFGWLLGLTLLFGAVTGINAYALKHSVEVISYEVRFTDPDHFSLSDYEKLEENYIISREGKIYTFKERDNKDD